MQQEMKDWLREIVARLDAPTEDEDLVEADLIDWASELMQEHWANQVDYPGHNYTEENYKADSEKMAVLATQVAAYVHDPTLPPLTPDCALDGIGIIYDEDRDDRVLLAVSMCKERWPTLVALAEHEGTLSVYTQELSQYGYGSTDIEVKGDAWNVREYVPYAGKWVEADHAFLKACVKAVTGSKASRQAAKRLGQVAPKPAPAPKGDWKQEPATQKQLNYLRKLGYTGNTPQTKGEAGGLIAQYGG